MKVVKRDGTIVDFNEEKIKTAITKANTEVITEEKATQEEIQDIINYISSSFTNKITVEEIQDIIENKLMSYGKCQLAKRYIKYRYNRELVRKSNTTDQSIKELIDGDSEYWNTENSNKNAMVATTQRDYIAGITSTDITRRFLLSEEITKAHDDGIIHFHDADYFVQKIHNCFSGDTKFITNKGVKPFNYFHDGDLVEVLDKDGVWRKATVKNYGEQSLNLITLKCGRTTKVIKATSNHRWILKDGSVTTNLHTGDELYALKDTASNYIPDDDVVEYFTYGFILGDGCDHGKRIEARLCGNKNNLLEYFIKSNYAYSQIKNSTDYIVYKTEGFSKQIFLNNKCWNLLNLKQKIALFHGYYAADGFKDRNGVSTSDLRLAEMIEDLSALAGYHISSKEDDINETGYVENAYRITYRFRKNQPVNLVWKVDNIEQFDGGRPRKVWCVEEPITNSFTLNYGIITGNCCLINLNDMLQNGTIINGVMIEKPHKFITASTIATQIILGVSSSQYGGCTVSLTHLAPFVRDSYNKYYEEYINRGLDEEKAKEFAKLDTKKEVEAGVQTFNYQVNSMTNTNGQAPFLSVCMYLGETEEYKEELAMIIEEFLNQRILGFKNSKGVYVTPAFPKLLYVLEEDNMYKDKPYYYLTELAAKCTAKRMVPDYISEKVMKDLKKNQFGNGDCYPCMGCRSFLTPWRTKGNPSKSLDYKEDIGKYYGRFNQGVVTINLPDIALSSKKDINKFWEIFDERLELCHRALQARHERLSTVTSDVAPIMWQNGALARLEKGESIKPLLMDGYSTISLGYAGLYECVKYMTGESHTVEGEPKEFGLKVMQHLNDACAKWKKEENIDYSVYGTPIESTTYKFAKKLKARFGNNVFVEIDGKDRDYITNSYHVPVFEEIDAFEKLALESDFQKLSPGGAISYIETPNLQNNIDAVLQVITFIYDNIMYAELNTKSDYCQQCGYDGEILIDENLEWYCPNCGNRNHDTLNVARRTCGYIGSNFWNKGRTQEIKERVLHLDNKDV